MRGTNRIFFTSRKWENVGGLIGEQMIFLKCLQIYDNNINNSKFKSGACLTLETADVKKLHLYGPPGVVSKIPCISAQFYC